VSTRFRPAYFAVYSRIGARQQRCDPLAGPIRSYAGTRCDAQRCVDLIEAQGLERDAKSLRDPVREFPVGGRQQKHELLAADPSHYVCLAHRGTQDRAELAQHRIASRMPDR
jgi:hypothetical protein